MESTFSFPGENARHRDCSPSQVVSAILMCRAGESPAASAGRGVASGLRGTKGSLLARSTVTEAASRRPSRSTWAPGTLLTARGLASPSLLEYSSRLALPHTPAGTPACVHSLLGFISPVLLPSSCSLLNNFKLLIFTFAYSFSCLAESAAEAPLRVFFGLVLQPSPFSSL